MDRYTALIDHAVIENHCVITLGMFDGVHRGHQHLIKRAKKIASQHGFPLVVCTFLNHPKEYIEATKSQRELTTYDQKSREFERLGVDIVLTLTFTEELRNESAENFLKKLYRMFPFSFFIAGNDVAFGKNREGTHLFLEKMAPFYNYSFEGISRIKDGDEEISSSHIRTLLQEGHLQRVEALLGRKYAIQGAILVGNEIIRTLGTPTFTMSTEKKALPPLGVYAGYALFDKSAQERKALIYIGLNETLHKRKEPIIEVHLLEPFSEEPKMVEVIFKEFLREDQKFDSKEALISEIMYDREKAKNIL